MSRENTRYGAFDVTLDDEIHRILEQLKEIGIKNPTKLEASAVIAEKNKRAKMLTTEIRSFISHLRGVN
jgi:hypothetical protein